MKVKALNKEQSKDYSQNTSGPPWLIMLVLLCLASTLLLISNWVDSSLRAVALVGLVGISALVLGSFLGFIFGIPRSTLIGPVEEEVKPPTNEVNASNSELISVPQNSYRPSTNLEQISDWLSKIIIGIGLVELGDIGKSLTRIGTEINSKLGTSSHNIEALTISIILIFAIIGFISSYLWTRIHYGGILTNADKSVLEILKSINKKQKEQEKRLDDQIESTKETTSLIIKDKLVKQSEPTSSRGVKYNKSVPPSKVFEWGNLPSDIVEKLERFSHAEIDWMTDPASEIFGEHNPIKNGRQLSVKIVTQLDDALVLSATVERISGLELEGDAWFLLHPTFPERFVKTKIQKGYADIGFYSMEWFTLVAIVDNGKTILVYDLGQLPGAPSWFK